MTVFKPTDMPLPPGLRGPEISGVYVWGCILEIGLALLIYGVWGRSKLRSRSTSLRTEIMRFINSFIIALLITSIIWISLIMTGFGYYYDLWALDFSIMITLGLFTAEIGLTLLIYGFWIHGWLQSRSADTETEITSFILTFMVFFMIVNALVVAYTYTVW